MSYNPATEFDFEELQKTPNVLFPVISSESISTRTETGIHPSKIMRPKVPYGSYSERADEAEEHVNSGWEATPKVKTWTTDLMSTTSNLEWCVWECVRRLSYPNRCTRAEVNVINVTNDCGTELSTESALDMLNSTKSRFDDNKMALARYLSGLSSEVFVRGSIPLSHIRQSFSVTPDSCFMLPPRFYRCGVTEVDRKKWISSLVFMNMNGYPTAQARIARRGWELDRLAGIPVPWITRRVAPVVRKTLRNTTLTSSVAKKADLDSHGAVRPTDDSIVAQDANDGGSENGPQHIDRTHPPLLVPRPQTSGSAAEDEIAEGSGVVSHAAVSQGLKRCECTTSCLARLDGPIQALVDRLNKSSVAISYTTKRIADIADGLVDDGALESDSKPSSPSFLPVLDNVINNIASLDLEQSDMKA